METDLLTELIGKKHTVLDQLRELARRQSQLIGSGEIVGLLTVLATKQQLLADLQTVERRLDPFRQQDPESRRWRSPEDRQRTRQLADRCKALLEEIMLLEKHSETDLVQRRDAAATQLQGMHAASEARSAYLERGPAPSRLDIQCE